jgi:hypothetical protein
VADTDPIHMAIAAWEKVAGLTDDATKNIGTIAKDTGEAAAEGALGLPGALLGVASNDSSQVAKAGEEVASLGDDLLGGDEKPVKKKGTKKAAAPDTGEAAAQQIEQQLAAAGVWDTLGQSLAGQQGALTAPVVQAASGGLSAGGNSQAEKTALSSIGLSPNDSAAKWLNAEIQQANTNDEPLTKAMNAYGAAYAQGQSGFNAALGAAGQANQLAVATAPEADWVNALAQHVISNVNYSGEGPTSALNALPPALQYYLKNSGIQGQSSSGEESVTALKPAGETELAPPTANLPSVKLPQISTGSAGAAPSTIPNDISNAVAG